jgi:hypothetical protein
MTRHLFCNFLSATVQFLLSLLASRTRLRAFCDRSGPWRKRQFWPMTSSFV